MVCSNMFKSLSKLIGGKKKVKKSSLEAEKYSKLIFKKNNLIIKNFANLKNTNKEVLKSLIAKELKTNSIFPNVFTGDLCFVLNDLQDLNYEISYTNGFNFGCSGGGNELNGFSCEYFHKIKIFSLYLKKDTEHLKGEKTTDLAKEVYNNLLGDNYIPRSEFENKYLEK